MCAGGNLSFGNFASPRESASGWIRSWSLLRGQHQGPDDRDESDTVGMDGSRWMGWYCNWRPWWKTISPLYLSLLLSSPQSGSVPYRIALSIVKAIRMARPRPCPRLIVQSPSSIHRKVSKWRYSTVGRVPPNSKCNTYALALERVKGPEWRSIAAAKCQIRWSILAVKGQGSLSSPLHYN